MAVSRIVARVVSPPDMIQHEVRVEALHVRSAIGFRWMEVR